MKLNHSNYFSLENQYISNSKIQSYKKCPAYFYKRYVTGELKKEITDSLIIGKAVDTWIMEGRKKFDDIFVPVLRRSAKSEDNRIQLTPAMFEQVCAMVVKLLEQPITGYLNDKYISQDILQVDEPIGQFPGLCGIPDWYKVVETKAVIVDLKTSSVIEPIKYHYHCMQFGYYEQQALYQKLLKKLHPEIKVFESYHLVQHKDTDKIYNCALFRMDQGFIEERKVYMESILAIMANDKDFKSPVVDCLDKALTIGPCLHKVDDLEDEDEE